ncbi:hypothetical protein LO771_00400 [Streptacidiphilus sp. ASG 303]|uniref:hypothetical protein n=1 Tax=Streptacidiphilus sp. ASG 303 TaxID=2896847 RepID=UPI001E4EBEE3|nr:hypothetical protein [Streptacidiphilus sp. ASG 303]MCD0480913.1 hypothetical protein [Streptacidiphilus sp. ASG 303]
MSDERRRAPVTRGWPDAVRTPGTDGWEETAVRWMWGLLPAAWEQYDVFHHQPLLLARQADLHLRAEIAGLRHGWSTTRRDLADAGMDPRTVDRLLEVYTVEGQRLREADLQLQMVTDALVRGIRERMHRHA